MVNLSRVLVMETVVLTARTIIAGNMMMHKIMLRYREKSRKLIKISKILK